MEGAPMSDESSNGGCGDALLWIGAAVIIIMVLMAGAGNRNNTTTTTNTTEVLSNNTVRIFSPDTNVYINSGNPSTDARTAVDGDRNNVQVAQPTTDPAVLQAAINQAIKDANAAMGVQP